MKKKSSYKVLIIDSSAENCKLAIATFDASINNLESIDLFSLYKLLDTAIYKTKVFKPENGLAEVIDFNVRELIGESGCSLSCLDFIICSAGPGSYTGLRTGLAFCYGLVNTLNKPLILVSRLLASALDVYKSYPDQNKIQLTLFANKEEKFFLSLSKDTEIKPEQIKVIKNSDIIPAYIPIESLIDDRLILSYFACGLYAYLKGVEHVELIEPFSNQLLYYSPGSTVIEPLYVKGVAAMTLKERGVINSILDAK